VYVCKSNKEYKNEENAKIIQGVLRIHLNLINYFLHPRPRQMMLVFQVDTSVELAALKFAYLPAVHRMPGLDRLYP